MGQGTRLFLGFVDQGYLLQHKIYVVTAITNSDPVAGDAEILTNREIGEGRGGLKLPRDAGTSKVMHWTPAEISALERNFAGIQSDHATKEIEQTALAGSIGSDDAHQVALPDRKVDPVDGEDAAEALAQVACSKQDVAHGGARSENDRLEAGPNLRTISINPPGNRNTSATKKAPIKSGQRRGSNELIS